MKLSGKGVVLLILILVIIPVVTANFAEGLSRQKDGWGKFSMPRYMLRSYVFWLPVYIVYVLVAFRIMQSLRKHRY